MKPPVVLLFVGALPLAAAPAPDKSAYSLANPTPAGLLRELAPDRSDFTEGPFTVDAGHLQLEMDFANFTRNRLDGTRTAAWSVAPLNLRLGLLSNVEAGLFVAPYQRVRETPRGGLRTTRSGFGDITCRAKFNFWGNDGGESALGLITDLTLPTAADGLGNDHVEGAVTLPAAFDFGDGWELGAMTRVSFQRTTNTRWTNSVSLGRELAKNFSGYAEIASVAGDGSHVATFDVGVAWKLDANTQLDCGANFGLTRHADDVQVFAGLTRRF